MEKISVKKQFNQTLVLLAVIIPFLSMTAAPITGEHMTNTIGMELTQMPTGYWVGTYPVTQQQYSKMNEENPSRWKGENHPAENVDWDDAVAFCKKLTAADLKAGKISHGWQYQLPTQEQWEYFAAGAQVDDMVYGRWDGLQPLGTQPVGSLGPNPFGLFDVLGNVWEWCEDWWGANRIEKVLKGGAWDLVATEIDDLISSKPLSAAVARDGNVGFRVILIQK